MNRFTLAALSAAVLAIPFSNAWACSSCGCTLNSDWSTQGFHTEPGWTFDLRHDHFNQTDLRSGTGRASAGARTLPSPVEIQNTTANRNTTLTADYGFSEDWGLTVLVPYLSRGHSTWAAGDTELSTSSSSGLGDVRVLGRYQGFSPEHDWGLQFGLKLPTGSTHVRFEGGPQAGQPLDRGLQPGTGSTDLLLGAYTFGPINQSLDYFAQALLQLPVTARDDFKPGAGINLTAGVRYASEGPVSPHLQVNVRSEKRESGAQADVANSGATLVYLSPGATWTVTEQVKVYGFVQVPIYQRVNGLQLEPRTSLSVGVHYTF